MRKTISIALCLLLAALPVISLAEDTGSALIFTGKVEAKDTVTIKAPFGGAVQDFTLQVGDGVSSGDALMALGTTKIYAPYDGTVRGVFAKPGDAASAVQNRYGALCYIEPAETFLVQATTSNAYNDQENRTLHMGEKLYLSASSGDREGVGRVITVSGEVYVIEVTEGDLEARDTVNIFRDSDYTSESRVGRGSVTRNEPIAIAAPDGSILSVSVREGSNVKRGDVMFEVVSGTFDALKTTGATVYAPVDGVVASIAATGGQMANKDQPLLTLYTRDTFQLVSTVTELDVQEIAAGDTVKIVLDGLPGSEYTGTIVAISGIGSMSDNYTEYAVRIDFTPDDAVRLGMSGTAYPVK